MKTKKLFKYLPVTVMTAGIVLATSSMPLSLLNNTYNFNNQILNTAQQNTDTAYSDQLEYIRNDVAKQTGVNNSIASIKLADSGYGSGSSAAIVTKTDGSTLVYMWGLNNYGQLGNGTVDNSHTPKLISSASFTSPVAQIAVNESHSAALLEDGSLYMWGRNNLGQLGNGTTISTSTPIKIIGLNSRKIVKTMIGEAHSAAILEDGSLYMWGNNNYGQLGNTTNSGTNTANTTPALVTATALKGKKIAQIALGYNHSAALLEDGSLHMWGYNYFGQLANIANVLTNNPNPVPFKVTISSASPIAKITLGQLSSAVVLKDGSLYMWGSNTYGLLGIATNLGTINANPTPAPIAAFSGKKIIQIGFGEKHSAALLADGSLYTWGKNDHGQLGNTTHSGTTTSNIIPALVTALSGKKITKITLGIYNTTALAEDGNLYVWGYNGYGQLGFTANTIPNPTPTWMSQLGKDSHITAKSTITAKNAVDNLWVDNKFNLAGFKNSFNLINIPDVADQTYKIATKPTYDIATGTVTMNIKIKYFYNENGLIVTDTAIKSTKITGFKEVPNRTNITVKTAPLSSIVVDKWLSYVTVDEKISRAKLEEFLNLIDVPTDTQFTVTSLNPINETGALTFSISTSKIIDAVGDVLNTTSGPFPITLNLTPRITTMTQKTSYPGNLTPTALKAKLVDNNGLVKDISELNKYLTIVAPVDGVQYHLVDNEWDANGGDGTVKFAIYASKYYDTNAIEQTGSGTIAASKVDFTLQLESELSTITVKSIMPNVRIDNFETYIKFAGITVATSRLGEFFDSTNIPSDATFDIANIKTDEYNAGFTRNHLTFDLTINKFNQGSPATAKTYTQKYDLTLDTQHRSTVIKAKPAYDQSIRVDKVADALKTLTGIQLVNYLNNYLDLQSIPDVATINVENVISVDETGKLTFDVIISQIYNASSDLTAPADNRFSMSLELKSKEFIQTSIRTLPTSVYPQDLTPAQFKQRLKTDGATDTGETYALSATNIDFLKKFLIIESIPADAKYTMTFVAQTYATTVPMNFSLTLDKYYNAAGDYTAFSKTYNGLSLSLMETDLPVKPKTEITTKSDAEVVNTCDDFLNSISNADGSFKLEELCKYIDGLNTLPLEGNVLEIIAKGVKPDGTANFVLKVSSFYNGTDSDPEVNGEYQFTVRTNQVSVAETFQWWWILAGVGGAAVIGLALWFFLKKSGGGDKHKFIKNNFKIRRFK